MNFKLISNLDEAKSAWNSLSPNKVIYDDWDFRYAYYKYFNYPLYFYAAYDNDELVALLPLMLNTDTNLLDFFAGFEYMEDNRVFAKAEYEYLAQNLLDKINLSYSLNEMNDSMQNIKNATFNEFTYHLPIGNLTSSDDFINDFYTGNKNDLRKELNKINELGVNINTGNKDDLEKMFEFNINRFGDHSSFIERPFWKEFHRDIADNFDSKIIRIEKAGEIIAIGLSILYDNNYYGICSSRNSEIPNIGKYLIIQKIQEAIELGAKIYDAGSGDFGWKEKFGFSKRGLYQITNI